LHYATLEHTLEPWDGQRLEPPIHGIWVRRTAGATGPWTCELLLNEHTDQDWIFQRSEAVTRPLDDVGEERDGVPYLRPEIALLYKAGEPTPKNETDFAAVRPHLGRTARTWLRHAIRELDPQHRWVSQL